MKLDNFLKGPITSALGITTMVLAVVAGYRGVIPVVWEAAALFGIGFILLFMKDSLPGFIRSIVNFLTRKNGS